MGGELPEIQEAGDNEIVGGTRVFHALKARHGVDFLDMMERFSAKGICTDPWQLAKLHLTFLAFGSDGKVTFEDYATKLLTNSTEMKISLQATEAANDVWRLAELYLTFLALENKGKITFEDYVIKLLTNQAEMKIALQAAETLDMDVNPAKCATVNSQDNASVSPLGNASANPSGDASEKKARPPSGSETTEKKAESPKTVLTSTAVSRATAEDLTARIRETGISCNVDMVEELLGVYGSMNYADKKFTSMDFVMHTILSVGCYKLPGTDAVTKEIQEMIQHFESKAATDIKRIENYQLRISAMVILHHRGTAKGTSMVDFIAQRLGLKL